VGLAAKVRLTDVAFKNRDVAAGKKMLAALVRDFGDLPMIRLMAGERAMMVQDYADAAAHYDKLLALLPTNMPKETLATIYFGGGAAHERAGHAERAEDLLRQSLALQPANAQVLNYLGYMWVEQGKNLDEALVMLRKALAMAPQDGAVVDSVGWAYYMRGDYSRALIYLERAVDMEPDDAAVAEHLGDVYGKLGKVADAKRMWRQALELNTAAESPDDKLVGRVKKKLAQ
jgi:tetratricopeptide (TPR) repeat protein